MEWPSFLISSIFSMLLFIIGVFMILNVANAGKIDIDPKLDALNYGLLASRVLNSADCLAWEEKTPDGYLVHAGVIDANKLSNNENVRNCIFGKKYYIYVSIPGKPGMSVSDGLGFANNLPRIGNTAVDKKYYDSDPKIFNKRDGLRQLRRFY